MARKMLSAFPNYGKEKTDYLVTLTEFLTMWPREIVEPVCNPFTGVASRQEFPPSIFQMREALEAETIRQRRHREFLANPMLQEVTDEQTRRLQFHGFAVMHPDGFMRWTEKGIKAGCPIYNLPAPPADYVAPYVPMFAIDRLRAKDWGGRT